MFTLRDRASEVLAEVYERYGGTFVAFAFMWPMATVIFTVVIVTAALAGRIDTLESARAVAFLEVFFGLVPTAVFVGTVISSTKDICKSMHQADANSSKLAENEMQRLVQKFAYGLGKANDPIQQAHALNKHMQILGSVCGSIWKAIEKANRHAKQVMSNRKENVEFRLGVEEVTSIVISVRRDNIEFSYAYDMADTGETIRRNSVKEGALR